MNSAYRFTRLLAAAALLTACAKADAPNTDSAGAVGATTTITPSTAGTPTDSMPASTASATGGMVDPNAATRDQLVGVTGMTPAAADALIAGRPYADMTAADRALAGAGLDSATRKQVYARVWKPIDINRATKAEILLIPGVGARMHHEFEEYRPYKDVAQFDREIGKYVDKTELARLRTYVMIP